MKSNLKAKWAKPARQRPAAAVATAPPPLPPPRPWAERLRFPGWLLLSVFIALFYLWTATSSNRPFHPRDTSHEFYNQLTDSLLQGHVYLPAVPSPRLLALPDPYDPAANETMRLHDASLYKGRYYLYFGIAPALVMYAPVRWITGLKLSDDVAVAVFCLCAYVFACLLLFLLLDAAGFRIPIALQALAVLALGLGQVAPIVLRRPRVYEVAVSAGYCFLLGGIYFLARRVLRSGSGQWPAVLAAVFFGLGIASRPHIALTAIFALILYGLFLDQSRGLSGLRWYREIAFFAVPLAAAFVLVAWYNYVRFDNPFEFGVRYQVGAISFTASEPLSLRVWQALASVYYFLICLPNLIGRFPFLELSGAALPFGSPDLFPKGYYHEPLAGFLVIAPLCLAGIATPFLPWTKRLFPLDVRAVLTSLVAVAFAMFAAVCVVPKGALPRYELDFVPELLIVGLCFCLGAIASLPAGKVRSGALALTVAGCLGSSVANVALSINSYGYSLQQSNPPLFRSLAMFFGAGPDAVMRPVQSLHFDATVTFARKRPETRESILASGIWEAWDLLLVKYVTETEGTFAFVNCAAGDTETPSFPLLPGKQRHLTMDYAAASRHLVVRLDDRVVMDYRTGYHPTAPDQITIGTIRVGRFGVRNFSGKISVNPGGLVLLPRS